jgi:dUTP pyrophosphatase
VSEAIEVRFRLLPHAEGLAKPERATGGSAGFDLRAACDGPVSVAAGERAKIPTGLVLEITGGFEAQVRPRSGLAWKQGLTVVNAPGTIDSDYRGEVCVLLINLGREAVTIERGDRVAQLVVQALPQVRFEEAHSLDETERGAGGFGHSGRQ